VAARIQFVPPRPKRGEIVEIRVLIQHNMETGYRTDMVGGVIPRNCINVFSCRYNGAEVFRADLSPGISANPLLQFCTVAETSGELEFSWMDDQGKQDSERARIVVGE
jgi:sulfur-oxidizing protein SoxZ